MCSESRAPGRRERGKQDKRERIMLAARDLFALHGVRRVTTQQIADQADVAIGTLYLYAATKAELLIMVQNRKFAAALDEGVAGADKAKDKARDEEGDNTGTVDELLALMQPVVACLREHLENGPTYLHELVFGDPGEPYRREGLMLAARLEDAVSNVLSRRDGISSKDARTLARVISAILHLSTTAAVYIDRSVEEVLADISEQTRSILAQHQPESTTAAHGLGSSRTFTC
ncbi:AcrR family transcriptional regulator [Arthrobacter pascens]|uniref:TetR/AcrR family transcriptional regulator n=1 Tax=Arthrobacter pascens TaxID=1677 RepID=UPI0027895E52|nr:TetR/AcrR family transcriptional regulator [Arthrobacter pascens]MDQ0632733.1 AcrR family transcriptional regulator [Arthrobacter pascens]